MSRHERWSRRGRRRDRAQPAILAAGGPDPDNDPAVERHKLTALEGLAALSLDALSSVAYGPEAIVIVLMTAGAAALDYTLPVTIAIVVLLSVLVISYRQVIEAFPPAAGHTRWPRRTWAGHPAW